MTAHVRMLLKDVELLFDLILIGDHLNYSIIDCANRRLIHRRVIPVAFHLLGRNLLLWDVILRADKVLQFLLIVDDRLVIRRRLLRRN